MTRVVIELRNVLAAHWGFIDARIEEHHGGMNSATWWVEHGGLRFVAKHTPGWNRDQFLGGITVAAHLARAGIASGEPVPTRTGGLVAVTDDGPVALLRYVPGQEPPDDESGQRLMGATLGRVHLALRGAEFGERFHWLDPAAAHLDGAPDWVRPGIVGALQAYDDLDPSSLTWGMLHTDPAPEAFLADPASGDVGLIDWSVAMYGPLLYDVASAALYLGGPDSAAPLVDAYVATGALDTAEAARGLNVFHRLRWAVQADYFAARLAANDLTGIADAAENEAGMLAAREML